MGRNMTGDSSLLWRNLFHERPKCTICEDEPFHKWSQKCCWDCPSLPRCFKVWKKDETTNKCPYSSRGRKYCSFLVAFIQRNEIVLEEIGGSKDAKTI